MAGSSGQRAARSGEAVTTGAAGLERLDVDSLPRRRALGHGVCELHVTDAFLEARARDLFLAPNGVDELLLHPPAHALLLRDDDLLERRVALAAARQSLRIRFQTDSPLGPEDPYLRRRGQCGHGAEANVGDAAAGKIGVDVVDIG